MPRVHAYIRVSTDDQKLGPDAQREQISIWATREGATIAEWHEDLGVSGAAPLEDRPGLLAALDDLGKGDKLVVAKRDRLARDVFISAMIERLADKAGAAIVSADGAGNGDGPEAQLMRQIFAALAQYERALIRARTKAALAVKKSRNERVGYIPYGYSLGPDGKTLEPVAEEQAVLISVTALRVDDGWSYQRIADYLNASKTPSRGGQWFASTIHRVLARYQQSPP